LSISNHNCHSKFLHPSLCFFKFCPNATSNPIRMVILIHLNHSLKFSYLYLFLFLQFVCHLGYDVCALARKIVGTHNLFFSACEVHSNESKTECNKFWCLNCYENLLCESCVTTRHKDHQIIQVSFV
jgi:hypothetical protein